MQRKFLHEHHNRQDKIWKEPTGCVGSKESPSLWEFAFDSNYRVYWKLNRNVDRLMRKQALVEGFKSEVRNMRFIVEGYKFKFTYNLQAFSHVNKLRPEEVRNLFDRICNAAAENLRIVILRMCRAKMQTRREWNESE